MTSNYAKYKNASWRTHDKYTITTKLIDRTKLFDIIVDGALQQVFENWRKADRRWVPQVIKPEPLN
jgi:hypothetical protein